MENYSIRKIIDSISSGGIRIPSFQRDFVWEPEDVAFLMDSIYKRYPIGSVLLWRTSERLHTEKKLGKFDLPEPKKDYPIDYVLDGQQRLTAIFSVFQTELEPNENRRDWRDIYYLIGSGNDKQKTSFVALREVEVDSQKHFPLSVLFSPVEYRKSTSCYNDVIIEELDRLQTVFKEAIIPVELMESEDKENVAIVFERINRAGVPLDSFQLLTAWSWSTDFDLQQELDDLSEELAECGFDGLSENQDLLMKCFTGYIVGETSPDAIMKLDGDKIRKNYSAIVSGIKSTIDFLKNELNIYSLKYMPYPSMLVSLVRFFGSNKSNGELYTEMQRKQLVKWFWRSCFSRRYSSGVNDIHRVDIDAMKKLKQDQTYIISNFPCEIPDYFFTDNRFGISSVNTKTFIIMLASKQPCSFISGARVNLDKTLQVASSKEFHHIFPDKFLQKKGMDRDKIYQLANFCFLNNVDNQKIKDKDPKDYKHLMPQDKIDDILKSAICPANALDLDFNEFIKKRNSMLLEYARTLIC